MTHLGMMRVPPKKQAERFREFVDLPITDSHCEEVDMTDGMWYYCSLCKKIVKVRAGREWTLSRWIDHTTKEGRHDVLKQNVDAVSGIREKEQSGAVS